MKKVEEKQLLNCLYKNIIGGDDLNKIYVYNYFI
jgi:hypothetical protein